MRRVAKVAVIGAAALAAFVSLGLAGAAPSQSKTIHDGVFTATQVEAGQEVYSSVCLECHPRDYFGPIYLMGWAGATVAELFEQIELTMPYENPGTLERRQYMEVVVYIFSLNGVSPGEEAMDDSEEALQGIVIDGPFKWRGGRSPSSGFR